MSTKIYDAYKYNGSLYDLLNQLKEIRKEYQKEKIDRLSIMGIIEIEVEHGKKVFLKDLHKEILGDLFFGDYLEKRMKIGYNEPQNISASVIIYPYKNGEIYLHFFGLNQKHIKKINGLSDYHYQNQSDMSNYDWQKEKWEDMSEERKKELEKDWDERRDIWDELLGHDIPSESGFIFNFYPVGYSMTVFCNEIIKKSKDKYSDKPDELIKS
jgi:hypothetical protein